MLRAGMILVLISDEAGQRGEYLLGWLLPAGRIFKEFPSPEFRPWAAAEGAAIFVRPEPGCSPIGIVSQSASLPG
jgi:hypothetical protein